MEFRHTSAESPAVPRARSFVREMAAANENAATPRESGRPPGEMNGLDLEDGVAPRDAERGPASRSASLQMDGFMESALPPKPVASPSKGPMRPASSDSFVSAQRAPSSPNASPSETSLVSMGAANECGAGGTSEQGLSPAHANDRARQHHHRFQHSAGSDSAGSSSSATPTSTSCSSSSSSSSSLGTAPQVVGPAPLLHNDDERLPVGARELLEVAVPFSMVLEPATFVVANDFSNDAALEALPLGATQEANELRATATAVAAAAAAAAEGAPPAAHCSAEVLQLGDRDEAECCRMERSNSCSQTGGELARFSASFAAGPLGAAPPSTSVSHENLATTASFVDASNLAPTADRSARDCAASRLSGGTHSSGPQQQQQGETGDQQNADNKAQQQAGASNSLSSRFFSSKLNTGSLWSLLSVGSAASTSALNEMASPEPARRDSSNQPSDKQQQAESSSSSVVSNFFTRQLQFAKRPHQQAGAASASFDQQSMTKQAAPPPPPLEISEGGARPRAYRFSVKYIGSAMLHKYFTLPMLEWVAKDIRRQTNRSLNQRQFTIPVRDVVFEIQASQLTAVACRDGHCIFVHPMHCVSKYVQLQHDATCFAYIIRDNKDSPSFCHLFQARSAQRVHEIFNAVRETTTRNQQLLPASSLRQTGPQSPLDSQQQPPNRLQKSASSEGHWKSLLAPAPPPALADTGRLQLSETAPIGGSQAGGGGGGQRLRDSFQQFPSIHAHQPREATAASITSSSAAAASLSCAQFENSYQFEVMFVKRVKLQCRRVPPTFVDDALETLKSFEATKTQIKGVPKRILSASVDERQEYETCQSPTPPLPVASVATSAPAEEQRRASSVSLRDQQASGRNADEHQQQQQQQQESKSCQQSPAKSAAGQEAAGAKLAAEQLPLLGQPEDPAARRRHLSADCLKGIGLGAGQSRTAAHERPPATFFNDFSPYNTITSMDLNERIAAIPVVSSSVSLDHETRQRLARQVRETIMATAATIKKDAYQSSGGDGDADDQLGHPGPGPGPNNSSRALDSLVSFLHQPAAQDHQDRKSLSDEQTRGDAALLDLHERRQSSSVSGTHLEASQQQQRQQQQQQLPAATGAHHNNFDLFRRASARQVVKNRTMLLLIGKDELCAISIDKHQMLFSKSFNALVHCLQGMKNQDHFGLICRDSGKIKPQAESFAGFVFKCQADKVVREIMAALKQVIYSSQHNFHGSDSPYNPLNYPQAVGHSQRESSIGQLGQQRAKLDAQLSEPLRVKGPSKAPLEFEAASSLAAKRGFAPLKTIEAGQAQRRAAEAANLRAGGPPPSAPALNFSQMPPAIPIASQPQPQPQPQIGHQPIKNPIRSMFCDDCPLYWFHRLCCDVESLPAEASKAIILRRIDASLTEREQDEVYSKFSDFQIESIEEHNEIFMSILRQASERKQLRHNQGQAHASAMAKSAQLAKQQSCELLKLQQQQQQRNCGATPPAAAAAAASTQAPAPHQHAALTAAYPGHAAGHAHQRSGSSGGSLVSFVGGASGQTGQGAAGQSLVDASSAAIDNLKRAKNSISVSIENLLKRRSSLRNGEQQDDLMAIGASLLSRAGSFKGGAREFRAANSDLERGNSKQQQQQQQLHDGSSREDSAFVDLRRSQSTSDYCQAEPAPPTTTSGANLKDSGTFKRNSSFGAPSELEHQASASDSRLDSKRTSTDSLSLASQTGASEHSASSRQHSPSRQAPQAAGALSARWMPTGRMLVGHASPSSSSSSSYLSGSFWKKNIFDKIHQPAAPTTACQRPDEQPSRRQTLTRDNVDESGPPAAASEPAQAAAAAAVGGRSRDELRALWRKAILEQITLLKMDRQNQKLAASSIECNIQRMKLNYRDVPFGKGTAQLWDKQLKQDPTRKVQFVEVANLVRLGVPKQRRGEVWMFLMNQYQLRHGTSFQPPPDSEFKGDADQAYRSLLSQLSTQQHEIFVDIGRTFPAHPYYSQYLSIGQLSLFNLLKAYSLLDQEVGYCQGLSFVAGILLLHVESEDEAFELMRHLLFNFGLRKQYLPSMSALHLQLYQLTRLLRDHQYAIFEQFDKFDISPSLYAAPWFLTLFASQFPLGFVARLLDLVYLIGIEAIFRVSLTLLAYHRESLLGCTSLEMTMDFMRAELIKIDDANLAKIFDDAIALDLRNKLIEYEIEYSFYCAEDKARANHKHQHQHHHDHHHQHHHLHHRHALAPSRQSANSSSSTVNSDVRDRADNQETPGDEQAQQLAADATEETSNKAQQSNTENGHNETGFTSEVADATATVIIQHLLANNHLRSLRSNYTY